MGALGVPAKIRARRPKVPSGRSRLRAGPPRRRVRHGGRHHDTLHPDDLEGYHRYTVDLSATTNFVDPEIATPTYANVCVGELVGAAGSVSNDTVAATTVYVAPPALPRPHGIFGTVTSAGGSTTTGACGTAGDTTTPFIMTKWKGATAYTVTVTSTTSFASRAVTSPTYANVCVGDVVGVVGTVSGSTVTADTVYVTPPQPQGAFGTVTSAGGSTTAGVCGTAGDTTTPFILTTWRGTTAYTVDLSATTNFVDPEIATPTYANVCVGELVGAAGSVSNDTVAATTVYVAPPALPRPHGIFGTVTSAGGSTTTGVCGTAGDTTTPFIMTKWKGATAYTVTVTSTTSFVARKTPRPPTPTSASVTWSVSWAPCRGAPSPPTPST